MKEYWMFYADVFGDIPMGSDSQMKVPAKTVANASKLVNLALNFKAGRRGTIYLMDSWTQAMCELGPRAFSEYIAKHGTVIHL